MSDAKPPTRRLAGSNAEREPPGAGTNRAGILVLGMHRSGTSAVTRAINLLGADLPSNLMPAVKGNNDPGFWESLDVYRLNDDILESAGSRWDDWKRFHPERIPAEAELSFKARAQEILQGDFAESACFVLKDPRICLLLPFWLEALHDFGADPKVVLPIRNPLEVAASLERRNSFSAEKSLLIWLRYILDAEHGSRGLHRVFLSFDALLDDWRAAASKLSMGLGFDWPRDPDDAAAELDDFLSYRHRHHSDDVQALNNDSRVSDWVKDAFSALNQLQAIPEPEAARGLLDGVRSDFDRASDVFGAYVQSEQLGWKDIAELKARNAELEQTSAHQEAMILEMQQNALRREDRIQGLEGDAAQRARLIDDMQKDAALRDDRIRELQGELAQRARLIDDMRKDAALRDDRIREVQGELAQRVRLIDDMRKDAALRDDRIRELGEYVAQRDELIGDMQRNAVRRDEKIRALERVATDRAAAIQGLNVKLDAEQQALRKISALKNRLLHRMNAEQTSAAGQLTRPLRSVEQRSPKLIRAMAAVPRLAVWTITLRLPQRLRIRRQATAMLNESLINVRWYVERNPDIVLKGQNPVIHWVTQGWREGRDPDPRFNVRSFLESHPGAEGGDLDPLIDFLRREATPAGNANGDDVP